MSKKGPASKSQSLDRLNLTIKISLIRFSILVLLLEGVPNLSQFIFIHSIHPLNLGDILKKTFFKISILISMQQLLQTDSKSKFSAQIWVGGLNTVINGLNGTLSLDERGNRRTIGLVGIMLTMEESPSFIHLYAGSTGDKPRRFHGGGGCFLIRFRVSCRDTETCRCRQEATVFWSVRQVGHV